MHKPRLLLTFFCSLLLNTQCLTHGARISPSLCYNILIAVNIKEREGTRDEVIYGNTNLETVHITTTSGH